MKLHPLRFKGLMYEMRERQNWVGDDNRWGQLSTTPFGFWLIAFFGRFRRVFAAKVKFDN